MSASWSYERALADVHRVDLHHQRICHPVGQIHGFVLGGCNFGGVYCNAIRVQKFFCFNLSEAAVFPCQAFFNKGAGALPIEVQVPRELWRDFLERFEVAGVPVHEHESPDSLLWRLVSGNGATVQNLSSFFHIPVSHPGGKEGERLLGDSPGEMFRHPSGIGHRLRGENYQHSVYFIRCEAAVYYPRVTVR